MESTNTKQQYFSVKKKLTAAIAMLLIAVLMVVNSTYAWFTLSTAPEVTGIQTTVGANGNLEIALAKTSAAPGVSGTADSMTVQDVAKANITWGNLVDLSEGYGLDQIRLMPAALQYVEGSTTTINSANPLSVPEYGYDGRVSALNGTKAIPGIYVGSKFIPIPEAPAENAEQTVKDAYVSNGVRAIGESLAQTPQMATYNSEKVRLAAAVSEVKTLIKTSLATRGPALASIVAQEASAPAESYDTTALKGAVADLTAANERIAAALLSYAKMKAASTSTETAEEWNDRLDDLETPPAAIEGGDATYAAVYALYTKINTALDGIDVDSLGTTATWGQISTALNALMNSSAMTVAGMTMAQIQAAPAAEGQPSGKDQLVTNVLKALADVNNGGKVPVVLPEGENGVYADFAKLIGQYSENIQITGVTYGSLVNMTINSTLTVENTATGTLTTLGSAANSIAKPANTASADPAFTDTYGYILDFWFRTNAANSNLKLQVEGANRIYDGGSNEEVMGSGSNAVFTSIDSEFKAANMIDLLDSMKIVFFKTATGEIIATAKFDTTAATSAAGYVATANTVTVNIKMDKKANGTDINDNTITALNQNEATAISVLVYLDGNTVQNKDVANAASSMRGTLNFQFASDATLVPMEYTPLK